MRSGAFPHDPRRGRHRASLLVLAAFAALPCGLRPAVAGEPPPPRVATVPDEPYPAPFRAAVSRAIDRGVAALRREQRKGGRFGETYAMAYPLGETALATFTLLQCGVPADDPAVVRALGVIRRGAPKSTYENALCALALGALCDPAEDPFAGETLDATGRRVLRRSAPERLSEGDRGVLRACVDFLVKHQGKGLGRPEAESGMLRGGGWAYGVPTPDLGRLGLPGSTVVFEPADASNTQYALLGLKAGARCGIEVPEATWLGAVRWLLAAQVGKGPKTALEANEVRGPSRREWTMPAAARGFGYTQMDEAATGSMTAAGAAGLLLCESELRGHAAFTPATAEATGDAVRDAFAWMQARYSMPRNPGESKGFGIPGMTLYWLYGLERMCTLGHARFVGAHDWYLEGAQHLLGRQKASGAWGESFETCFALLFLRRATVRTREAVITPAEEVRPAPAPRPEDAAAPPPAPGSPAPTGPGGGKPPDPPGSK